MFVHRFGQSVSRFYSIERYGFEVHFDYRKLCRKPRIKEKNTQTESSKEVKKATPF